MNVTHQVAIDSEGRILVVATGQATGVFRLNDDGSLDQSFGPFGGLTMIRDGQSFPVLAVGPNDTVLLAGGGDESVRFARLTESGELDGTFGQAGIATVQGPPPGAGPSYEVGVKEVAPTPDGSKIVAVGWYHYNAPIDESYAAVGRVTSSGVPDPAFNSTGAAGFATPGRPPGSCCGGLGIQTGVFPTTDGRTVIGGNWPTVVGWGSPFVIARLNDDSQLDPSFGNNGTTSTSLGDEPGGERAQDLVVQSDGKLILAGLAGDQTVPDDSAFGLARYTPDGFLDPSYGAGGIVRTPLGVNVRATSAAITAAGRVVVAGHSFGSGTAVLARYLADGEGSSGSGSGEGIGGSGGVAGGVATNFRNIHVHKLVVPKSREKLAARGVKVLASCDEDCRIVLELGVSQAIANAMGLSGTLLARASRQADAGERRWVRAKPGGAVRRALRAYDGEGRLQVDVTGVAR